jgi:hypothetical protein
MRGRHLHDGGNIKKSAGPLAPTVCIYLGGCCAPRMEKRIERLAIGAGKMSQITPETSEIWGEANGCENESQFPTIEWKNCIQVLHVSSYKKKTV